MELNLKGKSVIVTGGGSNIGRGIALAYLHRPAMAPGTAVRVRWEGGEESGQVAGLPFYRRGGSGG